MTIPILVGLVIGLIMGLPGCAHSERPVPYPNDHLKQAGQPMLRVWAHLSLAG